MQLEYIMHSLKFELRPPKARLAAAVFALVCSLACLSAVLVVFASSSGELDPLLAKVKPAPAASAVADKAPVKPAPG
jgi:hypothetical protein